MSQKHGSKTHKYMIKLGVQLMLYRYAYYIHNNPIVSDKEYDRKERDLVRLENAYRKWMYKGKYSVTQTVGSDIPELYPGFIRGMYEYMMNRH